MRAVDAWTWRTAVMTDLALGARPIQQRSLRDARGLPLAEDVRAPENIPALPVSAMDGFAVRWSDLDGKPLPVGVDIPAGTGAPHTLPEATAARIMTGAPLPLGADTVIPVELTDADPYGPPPAQLRLREGALDSLTPGRHVRGAGEEVSRGQIIAAAGTEVRGGLIGLAAALGMQQLPVAAPWRVAVVVTGDELRSCDATSDTDAPPTGAVRESNGIMLAAELDALGCSVGVLRSGDDIQQLRATLETASADTDLVVTTGGVGHGAYDVVKAALRETSRFAHLDMKPGGPQGYGRLPDGTPAVHLPGTPVGALIGFHLFVRPLLGADATLQRLPVIDGQEPHGKRAQLHVQPGKLEAGAVRQLRGSRLLPYGEADALVLRAVGEAAADPALVLPLRR